MMNVQFGPQNSKYAKEDWDIKRAYNETLVYAILYHH